MTSFGKFLLQFYLELLQEIHWSKSAEFPSGKLGAVEFGFG